MRFLSKGELFNPQFAEVENNLITKIAVNLNGSVRQKKVSYYGKSLSQREHFLIPKPIKQITNLTRSNLTSYCLLLMKVFSK